jgi:hypothetical protein
VKGRRAVGLALLGVGLLTCIGLASSLVSGCEDVPGTAVPPDGGPDAPGCPGMTFFEDTFEEYDGGAMLDPAWEKTIEGANSFIGASTPADGRGAGDSNRYLLIVNRGSPASIDLTVATPPRDLSACLAAQLGLQFIVFSLETDEMDAAYIDLRKAGGDWVTQRVPFPDIFPVNTSCRPGGQDSGCVAWMPFTIDVPPPFLAPGVQARFHLHTKTNVSDAIGVDDVSLRGTR